MQLPHTYIIFSIYLHKKCHIFYFIELVINCLDRIFFDLMEDVVKKIYVQLDFDHFWTHSERAASNGQSRVQHKVGAIF